MPGTNYKKTNVKLPGNSGEPNKESRTKCQSPNPPSSGAWNLKFGSCDLEFAIWNLRFGILS
jgi:hypothetical protein